MEETKEKMGCFKFLKIMMFVFNSIIFLAGGAILGVGIWVKVDSGSALGILSQIDNMPSGLSQVLNVGYLMIALGAVLVILGFLGCCGAIKEWRWMLLLFFSIILLVFLAEVAGAIVILVFRPTVDNLFTTVGEALVESIQKDFGRQSDITGLWNATMTTLDCCGFYNVSDFKGSPYYVEEEEKFPPQCCPGRSAPCNETLGLDAGVIGCFQRIKDLVESNTVVIVAVALGIAFLELGAMTVAMILYCRFKSTGA